jgi:hypothetical protein
MQYPQHIFFSDETLPDETLPKDDIDKLFEKLERLEPPPSLLERILELTVKAPSVPQPSELTPYDPWGELYGPVIRNDKCEPC